MAQHQTIKPKNRSHEAQVENGDERLSRLMMTKKGGKGMTCLEEKRSNMLDNESIVNLTFFICMFNPYLGYQCPWEQGLVTSFYGGGCNFLLFQKAFWREN